MKIRTSRGAWAATLIWASTAFVIAFAGCNSARRVSRPQPPEVRDALKKEYQWKDMSTGRSFFRPIDPSSKD